MTRGLSFKLRQFQVIFLCLAMTLSFLGCLDSSDSLGNLPKMMIHRPGDSATIFVSSQSSDIIYDRINITIDNETTSRIEVFSLEVGTQKESFELHVSAFKGDRKYRFHGELSFSEEEEKDGSTTWELTVIDHLHDNITFKESLPYKQLLVSV